MLEFWQADTAGRFPPETGSEPVDGLHPALYRPGGAVPLRDPPARGGRRRAAPAPHIDVSIFARGLLQRLVTRVYFSDECAQRRRPGARRASATRLSAAAFWRAPTGALVPVRHPPARRPGDNLLCLVMIPAAAVRAHRHHRRVSPRPPTGPGCRHARVREPHWRWPKPPWASYRPGRPPPSPALPIDRPLDLAALGQAARPGANPVIPLVASRAVHRPSRGRSIGSTWARRARTCSTPPPPGGCARCWTWCGRPGPAGRRRRRPWRNDTAPRDRRPDPAPARAPTTFGRKAAGWLVATVDVAAVLGWPAGTAWPCNWGDRRARWPPWAQSGPEVVVQAGLRPGPGGAGAPMAHGPHIGWPKFRRRWRWRPGVAAKVALDVSLLMQTEVGEVSEPAAAGHGAARRPCPTNATRRWQPRIPAASRRAGALVGGHARPGWPRSTSEQWGRGRPNGRR